MSDKTLFREVFIGRHEELQALYQRATGAGSTMHGSVILVGERGVGKTALLRQLEARLFWKQDRVVPFRYTVNPAILDCADFARDYLAAFLRHWLAFETRDEALLFSLGMPLQELAGHAGFRGTAWAREVIARAQRCADDQISLLQTALQAPVLSALETGKPVAILLDDFPLLAGLRRGGAPASALVSLFNGPVAARQTLYVLAGMPSAFEELPLPALTEVPLRTFPPAEAEQLVQALLAARGASFASVPPSLVSHLDGNPLSIRGLVDSAGPSSETGEESWWTCYLQEVAGGGLYRYFSSILAAAFPAREERRNALDVLHHLYAVRKGSPQPLSAEGASALLRSGLALGAFGGFRPSDNAVLRDSLLCLFDREIVGTPVPEIVHSALDRLRREPQAGQVWDLTVPLAPRAELVVVESLQQIGKHVNMQEESIAQLQMAVIEACINAIEHTKGGDRRLYVSVRTCQERLEVSVESPGQEFTQAETGEPFSGPEQQESGRGQGIRLMKRFADAVRFERTGRGTRVVLSKYLSRQVNPEKEGVRYRE